MSETSKPIVVLDQVRKTYRARSGQVTGLAGVQLSFEPRQLVCIHGPSGAGKTTLLMAIGGMLRPTDGRVVVADHDLYAMTSEQRTAFRAQNVGFVFQMFHLVPYLSVLDNVWLAARREKEARQRAIDLLEQFGMGHRIAHRPAELSAGERQRTAIARALLNRPPVVLADEPTGNLDEENGAEVFRILATYRDQGGTVLVVTHGPEGRRYADRILSMRDGQIVDG
jgi:putative ABC transport system ATP-binding protein